MGDDSSQPLLESNAPSTSTGRSTSSRPSSRQKGIWHNIQLLIGVTVWMGSVVVVAVMLLVMIFRFAFCGVYDTVAVSILVVWVVLVLIPLYTPKWARAFVVWATRQAKEYFPVDVVVEDPDAWKTGGPYVVGFEPHSAMPLAMPPVFATGSVLLPKQLVPCNTFASTVCFVTPIVRHLYHWLGVRPISRKNVAAHLDKGVSVVLIPGGVQEILHMEHGKEVAFLRSRTGFVKLALQYGAPLVPAFGFGQTDTYHWYKPGPPWFPQFLINALSRSIGFVPLLFWGRWGSPSPFNCRLTVVVGRHIVVPKVEQPTTEQVNFYLQRFIEELQRIFEQHKSAAGYPQMTLEVL